MYSAVIATLILLLLPEFAFACLKHGTPWHAPDVTPMVALLSRMAIALMMATPLGFVAGRMVRRRFTAGGIFALGLVTSGLLISGGANAWACHGVKVAGPVLEQIYAAQVEYRTRHGFYASSFQELGITPPAKEYALFLPAETILPDNPFPKAGVDLSRLPEGVRPVASADRFTVVALAFSEPDQIDVWTMDQAKVFRESSVPAVQEVKPEPRLDQPSSSEEGWTGLVRQVESPVLVMTLLLGMATGFALAFRVPAVNRMARP